LSGMTFENQYICSCLNVKYFLNTVVLFTFQKPLPKLPIPDLRKTLSTYMTIMKSVISEDEYR